MRKLEKIESIKDKSPGMGWGGVLCKLCLMPSKLKKNSKEMGNFYEVSTNYHMMGQTQGESNNNTVQRNAGYLKGIT
jgi:hypothetical protein